LSREVMPRMPAAPRCRCPGRRRARPPMLGRPGCSAPLRKKVMAGAWLMALVYMDLTMQRSSAMDAVWGRKSQSQAPAPAVLPEAGDAGEEPSSPSAPRSWCSGAGPCAPSRAAPGPGATGGRACSRRGSTWEGAPFLEKIDHPARPGGEVRETGEAARFRAGLSPGARSGPPRRAPPRSGRRTAAA